MQQIEQHLGLPAKESAVYVALLELGTSNVSTVASKAGLNRTTTYDILESLQMKGLVTANGDTKKKTYSAEHPTTLPGYYLRRSRQFQRSAEDIEKLLPELLSLYNEKGRRPKIRFYEGTQGLESVYEDTLTAHEPIRAYASVDNMHGALPKYFPEYYVRRTKKGIAIRAIVPATSEGLERKSHDAAEMRESVMVPVEQFNFSPEINIYDDKVAIMSLAEEFGVIIESKEIATAQKKIFELAWIGAQAVARGVNGKRITVNSKS